MLASDFIRMSKKFVCHSCAFFLATLCFAFCAQYPYPNRFSYLVMEFFITHRYCYAYYRKSRRVDLSILNWKWTHFRMSHRQHALFLFCHIFYLIFILPGFFCSFVCLLENWMSPKTNLIGLENREIWLFNYISISLC